MSMTGINGWLSRIVHLLMSEREPTISVIEIPEDVVLFLGAIQNEELVPLESDLSNVLRTITNPNRKLFAPITQEEKVVRKSWIDLNRQSRADFERRQRVKLKNIRNTRR